MGKTICLTLTGRQRGDDGEELIQKTQVTAQCYEKNGSLYILYEETDGRSVTKNTIKYRDSVLELTKRGNVSARMVFQPGSEHMTDYATPYGCLKLGVVTKTVKQTSLPGYLKIQAEYTLTSGGSPISECSLTLLASEASSPESE